ncbi:hypothetical protein JB92DRAFT_3108669 [Gautieria morchelliformis]|nr:hypothetical protein JB92DRAFT_3108669 [Gautieria morchelliformis]
MSDRAAMSFAVSRLLPSQFINASVMFTHFESPPDPVVFTGGILPAFMAGFLTHPFFNYFQYIAYIVLHIPLMGYTVGLLADESECFERED